MAHIVIFHGSGETPDSIWYPYLKKELIERGHTVSIPQLPDTNNPNLEKWLPIALQEQITEDTILIGHSSGCPLIFSVLENTTVTVKQAILVAGFHRQLPNDENHVVQPSYHWEKIRHHCQDFVFINAVNDPWGCTDVMGREMFEKLGGTLIINNEGHMGSEFYKQPYKTFPFLLNLIRE